MLSRFFSFLLNPRTRLRPHTPLTSRPRARLTWRDILFNLPLLLGSVVVIGLLLIVLFGPLWATYDPHITAISVVPHFDSELGKMVRPPFPPSSQYPFGTDNWGNDLLSLILHGARVTLVAVVYITLGRVLLGTLLGGLAGWFAGRWPDQAVTALIAIITSLPILLSSYILIYALDIRNGLPVFLVALTLTGWTEIAQVVQSELLVIRQQLYIEAAVATGLRSLQIVVRHVLPNILPQLLVVAFLEMSAALLLLAELGFLGVFIGGGTAFDMGEPMSPRNPVPLPEVPEWGMLISQAVNSLRAQPYKLLAPALMVFVAVMGLNVFAEGLRTLLERASLNTSFLLRRRMVLFAAALILISAFILDYTGPKFSYEQAAQAFDATQAQTEATTLTNLNAAALDSEGHNEPVAYLSQQLTQWDWQRGWREEEGFGTTYFYPQTTGQMWVSPVVTPTLTLLDVTGKAQTAFTAGTDFAFVVAGHGGSGAATAPLTFVGFTPGTDSWEELSLHGRVAVLLTGNAPPTFATEALRRGAQAVLWLTNETTVADETLYPADAAADYLRNPTLPIVRLSQAATTQLLSHVGRTPETLLTPPPQNGAGWFRQDWSVQVALSVQLPRPQLFSQHSIIAFRSGYGVNLAEEMVVVLVCDPGIRVESGNDTPPNTASTALLLELARNWQEQNINPMRSVLFITWAGTPAEAQALLADPESFARLNPMIPSPPLQPAYVVVIETSAAAAATLWADPTSDPLLLDVFQTSARELDITTSTALAHPLASPAPLTLDVPVLSLRWSPQSLDTYRQIGQTLNLTLIKLVRQIVVKP